MIEIITNPEHLKAYFTYSPSLNGISLHEIILHRDGPIAKLRFDISDFPDIVPKKWNKSYNTAQMTISLIEIEEVKLNGFQTTEIGDLLLTKDKDKISFSFNSTTCNFSGKCSFIHIDKISGYRDTEKHAQQGQATCKRYHGRAP